MLDVMSMYVKNVTIAPGLPYIGRDRKAYVIRDEIEEGTSWEVLFADDLVLCDPDREMMEVRLGRWSE